MKKNLLKSLFLGLSILFFSQFSFSQLNITQRVGRTYVMEQQHLAIRLRLFNHPSLGMEMARLSLLVFIKSEIYVQGIMVFIIIKAILQVELILWLQPLLF
jgi:hypothetical protein